MRCGIEVNADTVDAVLNNARQCAVESCGLHVVLILTDTDGFRIYLHKLCHRVLQTSCDGHCGTLRNVEIRKFLSTELGRRIYRCARFTYHNILDVLGNGFKQICDKYFTFLGCRTVTDRDNVYTVLTNKSRNDASAFLNSLLRLCGIDNGGVKNLTRFVNDSELTSRTVSGVVSENCLALDRGLHDKMREIVREELYRTLTCAVKNIVADLTFDRRLYKAVITVDNRGTDVFCCGIFVGINKL